MFFLIAASVKIALVEIAILCFLFNSVEFLTHLSLSIQLLHLGFLFVYLFIWQKAVWLEIFISFLWIQTFQNVKIFWADYASHLKKEKSL